MKEHLREAALVDLGDEELKEFLGYTYHAIKNLDDEKKKDPDLAQMRDKLKQYVSDNYDEEIKRQKANMKAARALASARGIKWRLPEVEN